MTMVTRVMSFICVNKLMNVYFIFTSKMLEALVALKRFFTSVNYLMLF